MSRVNARAVAVDLEQCAWAQADVFAGQKRDADRLESAPDGPGAQQARAPAAPPRNRRSHSR